MVGQLRIKTFGLEPGEEIESQCLWLVVDLAPVVFQGRTAHDAADDNQATCDLFGGSKQNLDRVIIDQLIHARCDTAASLGGGGVPDPC